MFFMKLRLQTDYALRSLMYLGFVRRKATAEEIASLFNISKDHLVKIIQQLAKAGYVNTIPGRSGGVVLARDPAEIIIRDVVEMVEGHSRVLECVDDPSVCPIEPGCRLRSLLIKAESAFYATLGDVSIADLCMDKHPGGLHNLISNPA